MGSNLNVNNSFNEFQNLLKELSKNDKMDSAQALSDVESIFGAAEDSNKDNKIDINEFLGSAYEKYDGDLLHNTKQFNDLASKYEEAFDDLCEIDGEDGLSLTDIEQIKAEAEANKTSGATEENDDKTNKDEEQTQSGDPEVTVIRDSSGKIVSIDINDELRDDIDKIDIDKDGNVSVSFQNRDRVNGTEESQPDKELSDPTEEISDDATGKDKTDKTSGTTDKSEDKTKLPESGYKNDDRIKTKKDADGNEVKYVSVQAWDASKKDNNDCLSRIISNSYDLDALGIKNESEEYYKLEKAIMDANPSIYGDDNTQGREKIIDGTRHNALLKTGDEIILPDVYDITELGLTRPQEEDKEDVDTTNSDKESDVETNEDGDVIKRKTVGDKDATTETIEVYDKDTGKLKSSSSVTKSNSNNPDENGKELTSSETEYLYDASGELSEERTKSTSLSDDASWKETNVTKKYENGEYAGKEVETIDKEGKVTTVYYDSKDNIISSNVTGEEETTDKNGDIAVPKPGDPGFIGPVMPDCAEENKVNEDNTVDETKAPEETKEPDATKPEANKTDAAEPETNNNPTDTSSITSTEETYKKVLNDVVKASNAEKPEDRINDIINGDEFKQLKTGEKISVLLEASKNHGETVDSHIESNLTEYLTEISDGCKDSEFSVTDAATMLQNMLDATGTDEFDVMNLDNKAVFKLVSLYGSAKTDEEYQALMKTIPLTDMTYYIKNEHEYVEYIATDFNAEELPKSEFSYLAKNITNNLTFSDDVKDMVTYRDEDYLHLDKKIDSLIEYINGDQNLSDSDKAFRKQVASCTLMTMFNNNTDLLLGKLYELSYPYDGVDRDTMNKVLYLLQPNATSYQDDEY